MSHFTGVPSAVRLALLTALAVCALASGARCLADAQAELIKRNADELKALNQRILSKLKDVSTMDGRTIYLKTKVTVKADGTEEVTVEKFSFDAFDKGEIPIDGTTGDGKTLFLKGKVKKDENKEFHLDLEHVLPEGGKNADTARASGGK